MAKVIDGTLDGHALSGIAGVANIGTRPQLVRLRVRLANWYAFGRLAWDPTLDPRRSPTSGCA